MTQAVTATKKVLVIDDDPVVGKSFDRVLSPKGYAVISAADGEEALAKLAAEHYDVVFTDIKMPGMDGLEVAKRIKGSNPWMPARQLGVSHFLHKPLTPELIEATATYAYPVAALPAPSVDATVSIAKPEERLGFFKNVGLFIAAPFIGLAYVLVFPFVGLGMLGYVAYQALTQVKTGKNP
jgi:CheY-like chemotaxis protein